MASVANATNVFGGNGNEGIFLWLETVRMASSMTKLTEEQTARIIIYKIRETAQIWAARYY